MNGRQNVLWPRMVVRHVARQGMMGKVVFRWGWTYATWTVYSLIVRTSSLGFKIFKASNGTKNWGMGIQWQYSVVGEMATRGSSLFDVFFQSGIACKGAMSMILGMFFQIHCLLASIYCQIPSHGIFTYTQHILKFMFTYVHACFPTVTGKLLKPSHNSSCWRVFCGS